MSLASTSRTWAESKQGATDLLILLGLADHADDDGFCWPGIDTIAAKGRISRRQTFRVLQGLQKAGELLILPRTGPRSNCYIVAIGVSRSGIERSLIRAGKFGVGKKVLDPIREWLATAEDGQLPTEPYVPIGDKMSPVDPQAVGDTDDTTTSPRGDTDDTSGVTQVSPDPSVESSLQPDPSESAEDGASEPGDDDWLAETRIVEGDPEGEREMTPEEKAEMAAPGASADLQPIPPPGESPWIVVWRNTLRVRYQYGLGLEHVITWVERFADPEHANLPPPIKKGDAADWHGGAVAFLNRCYEDLVSQGNGDKPSAVLILRRALWCLDYFYWRRARGDDYYQHEITRPASLSNRTVAILARDLRALQEKFQLEAATMPKETHMRQAFRKGGKRGKRGRPDPEDERERRERQRRYDGGIPDELQTESVLARAAEQRAAAGAKRGEVDAEELPDVQGARAPETGRAGPTSRVR